MTTKLIYLENFELIKYNAKVIDIKTEDNYTILILDSTIFYPQGGGQPYDTGFIENDSGKFIVEEVRFLDGVVKHIGKFEEGHFNIGEEVICLINNERRQLHSKLHSAGHIVDMVVNHLKLDWIPGKGYHFPQGPYVEYQGNLEQLDKEKLKEQIETLANNFIKEGIETKLIFIDKEKMKEYCRYIPEYLPTDKPSRIVLYGNFGVPCGGTHVKNLADVKGLIIRKIKQNGPNIRVCYETNN